MKEVMETSMQRTEGNKKKSNEYKKSRRPQKKITGKIYTVWCFRIL